MGWSVIRREVEYGVEVEGGKTEAYNKFNSRARVTACTRLLTPSLL